ncbi:MAG TPA: excinuclease ABC subunit UvrC [Dehalococcoidia bacterium]|nr:excinuclease ABC subunit UvrC [Dehalococcoidia bacterium]
MKVQLEEQLKALPANPGVYLFKDEQGKIIYVGKAANLNNRVRSYFGTSISLSSKIQQLVSKIDDLEFMLTDSEQEALILECNLIKKYHPRYNVRLKDDKTFPYLKINVNEEWPGVYITRRIKNDGARYFGPFASAGSVRKTLRLIKKIFPFRSCTKHINGSDNRPCLNYYIHRCLGPCIGAVTKPEYQEVINQVILFLEGKQELVLHELNNRMTAAAQQLQFEKASLLRDQIQAIKRIIEGQKIAITLKGEQDAIALAQNGGQAYVEIFFIRNNKLIGHDHFTMEGIHDEKPGQIMTNFVKQYYASASYIPPVILIQYPVDEMSVLTKWLKERRRGNIKLQVPQRGVKKRLINIVAENADKGLLLVKAKQANLEIITSGLQELKDTLCLPKIPLRIEGYDISDIQGALAVGSMIALEKGLPKPSHYRRFRVKMVAGINDYAMIQEILRRRFKRAIANETGWANMPDLILIDGGKGHLNAALEVRQELRLDSIPMVSLAKENEEAFIPGKPEPVDIPKDSPALHILQRARDEAHRFAISYHRRLRYKESVTSILDDIPGIGPKRKKALLQKFRSVEAIKDASTEEISQTKGITLALANKIKEYL